jgi:hypothetical protein
VDADSDHEESASGTARDGARGVLTWPRNVVIQPRRRDVLLCDDHDEWDVVEGATYSAVPARERLGNRARPAGCCRRARRCTCDRPGRGRRPRLVASPRRHCRRVAGVSDLLGGRLVRDARRSPRSARLPTLLTARHQRRHARPYPTRIGPSGHRRRHRLAACFARRRGVVTRQLTESCKS